MLDPNNYRLDEGQATKTYTNQEVINAQDEIETKLVKENISDLKSSILNNGFLEVDKIVVKVLQNLDDEIPKYLVIEGNRRTSAFKSLISENYESGTQQFKTDFPKELQNKYKSINVILVQGTEEEINNYSQRLMGIRHVSGPKKWGGYQSAKLINDMWATFNIGKHLKYEKIGSFLGIRPKEVKLRHEAYLALLQMKKNPNYSSQASSSLYTLFHEMVSSNKYFKYTWLGWSDEKLEFTANKPLERVYKGILPDDEKKKEINNPAKLRHLAKIVAIKEVREQIESGTCLNDVDYDFDASKRVSKIKSFITFVVKQELEDLPESELNLYRTLSLKLSELISGEDK
ncbi:hypothetical protein C427_4736 [Paraglaciecola psychrophila 170]|uniref:ParB/Sulfiredoxin domain-containing protein n=2 Tax=Paraglaciecola TaxID=1621534 RepID=K6Z4A1_9ALTE|nr:hypothetical protein C427_4736 [Paraglaciecola psychrophila 170]GAC39884.1 hypothetical protein GPSY_4273 [Paraglaciecola psychrophila 170]